MHRLRGQRGFSLIETLIALGILGLIGMAFMTALGTGTKSSGTLDEQVQAAALARSQLADIMNVAYLDCVPPVPPNPCYTVTAWSCSSPSAPNFNLRRLVALLSPGFAFATNSSSGDFPAGMAPNNPQQSLCDGIPNDPDQTAQRPDYFPCPDTSPPIVNNSKHLEWPSATQSLWSGGNAVDISPGQTRTFRFTARPTTWGVYYIDAAVCYFSNATGDPGPCSTGNVYKTGKVAPVQVGIYNITGRGKGYVYMGSARLDAGGSELISQQSQ